MSARPRQNPTTRRAELAAVAASVFTERGVANTAVSDIVKAAGIAQGTFYLYFDSKDAVILAVVEQMVDAMVSALAELEPESASAVERLLGLAKAFSAYQSDRGATELVDLLHLPENRALHDRLAEHLLPGLLPLVESIVAQGMAEGAFDVSDPKAASWFVLGGLQSAELSGAPAAQMPAALAAATQLILRGLGYDGEARA